MTIRAETELSLVRVDDGEQGTTFYPSVSSEGVISWTNDGGKENPESRIIIGPQGPAGATGNGISSIDYRYKATTTQIAPSAASITSTTMPELDATNKYLWQKEVINYTNGQDQTTVLLLAVYGDKGDTGAQGPAGADGQDGEKGDKGDKGDTGATGPQGPQGPAGADGQDGEKGDTGPQGPQGVQGPVGADGKTYYTWIKYADTPTSGMSDNPTGKVYIGIAYNKTTATESTVYTDYSWSLIKGDKGDTGARGENGISLTSVTRYYQLSSTQPELPDPPVTPPGGDWQGTEPPYQSGNTSLWYVDVSVFSDDSVQYSDVGRSYNYQVVSDTRALAQTINENYIRWDATHQTLINTENGEVVDTISRYLRSFMQFSQTTNYGNPLLLLGDGTGVFTTAVSNKGMRFYQDTTLEEIKLDMEQSASTKAIAYFDNNQMKINRGVVVDRLQTGKFRWDSQSNDNLMFRWIG